MRLWTFQDNSSVETLKEGKIWYSTRGRRIKPVDDDYSTEEDPEANGADTYPIYTFARLYSFRPIPLCLYSFKSKLCYFVRDLNFDPESHALLELEVPDDEILSMKDMDISYVEYSADMPKDCPSYKRWQYRTIINKDKIVYNGYKEYVDSVNANIEALLPYIRPEWVVCTRTGEWLDDGNVVKVETEVWNKFECPTWIETVYVAGDGYLRDSNGKVLDFGADAEYLPKDCLATVKLMELPYYLHKDVLTLLIDLLKKKGIDFKENKEKTLYDVVYTNRRGNGIIR